VLEVKELHVHYGKAHAIRGISLRLMEGEVVTVLGPNGAGKTTLLHTISGLRRPSSGEILFENQKISEREPSEIVQMGIIQVPQGRQLFPTMTVYENLEMGAFLSKSLTDVEFVYSLFPRLNERRQQIAGTLSGGEAQMLAIGRGLMGKPRVLMLDEPSLGLAPLLVRDLQGAIQKIGGKGVSILLVEQNAKMALDIAHRVYVLQLGAIRLEGAAEELKAGDYVRRAYLG
jgi:branched-chain amino acid transport system ATP-binding protein